MHDVARLKGTTPKMRKRLFIVLVAAAAVALPLHAVTTASSPRQAPPAAPRRAARSAATAKQAPVAPHQATASRTTITSLGGRSPAPATHRAAPAPGSIAARAARDLQTIDAARPGARDLYELTRRLKLHTTTPIAPYIRASSPDYAVGRDDSFYVAQATSGYFTMKATLLYKTAHAYWYVQDALPGDRARLLTLIKVSANDFETHVYETNRAAFGQEWTPGIDRDPRITILNAELPGVGGYYSAEDLYPRSVNAYSNQRKMLYVSVTSYPLGTPDYASTVAHEFQHMIHWYQHERDDTWINEGSSVLAQVLNGYSADGLDASFALAPSTQLDDFCYSSTDCTDSSSGAHYGAGFLWMLYLYQHYGGDRALRAVLADKALSGITLFDDVLARLGSKDSARDAFGKWIVANYVDDPTIDGGAYSYAPAYTGCCIHAALTNSTSTFPYTRTQKVHQYAADYLELKPSGGQTLRLQFKGDATVPIVPNAPVSADGTEWWSNRGDEMDSTLTRQFDLTKVHHATLRYDTWYNVERDFDYVYVEASTDGGSTWTTLQSQNTTNTNPNGANYGNGYTGYSTDGVANKNGWLHQSVDLSPYAGKHVLVRFEEITDDAFNLSGFALDNVRVPEVGFADAAGTPGWQTQGWTRVFNVLPTNWTVQAIEYMAGGVRVVPLTVAAGSGALTIPMAGVQRVVLVVAATAPQTTVRSQYTLTVN